MRNRRRQLPAWLGPIPIIIALSLVLLISLIAVFSINPSQAKQEARAQQNNYQQARKQYQQLKPQENVVTSGKFDLTKHEQELTKQYTDLLNTLYGRIQSNYDLNTHKADIKRLLGPNGYSQIKEQQSGNQALAKKNDSTSVTFTSFNPDKLTIQVILLADYDLNNASDEADKGTSYLIVNYSFKTQRATSCQLTSSVHN